MKKLFTISSCLILASCAKAEPPNFYKINAIQLGMTKQQVMDKLSMTGYPADRTVTTNRYSQYELDALL